MRRHASQNAARNDRRRKVTVVHAASPGTKPLDSAGGFGCCWCDPIVRGVASSMQIASLSGWTTTMFHGRHDAFLAAFAGTANVELATFDKGFARYAELKCTIL
jgi:hypothetical protein